MLLERPKPCLYNPRGLKCRWSNHFVTFNVSIMSDVNALIDIVDVDMPDAGPVVLNDIVQPQLAVQEVKRKTGKERSPDLDVTESSVDLLDEASTTESTNEFKEAESVDSTYASAETGKLKVNEQKKAQEVEPADIAMPDNDEEKAQEPEKAESAKPNYEEKKADNAGQRVNIGVINAAPEPDANPYIPFMGRARFPSNLRIGPQGPRTGIASLIPAPVGFPSAARLPSGFRFINDASALQQASGPGVQLPPIYSQGSHF